MRNTQDFEPMLHWFSSRKKAKNNEEEEASTKWKMKEIKSVGCEISSQIEQAGWLCQ